ERSSGHIAAMNHADLPHGIARIRPPLPTASGIFALENNASRDAGRQQALALLIVAHRTDVLVREAIHHVLPGVSRVGTAEGAFTRSDHDLGIRSDRNIANAGDIR